MINSRPTSRIEQFFKDLGQASTCALVIDYDNVRAPLSSTITEMHPFLSSMNLLNAIVVSCRTHGWARTYRREH